jgi:hypothetical protein
MTPRNVVLVDARLRGLEDVVGVQSETSLLPEVVEFLRTLGQAVWNVGLLFVSM